MLASVTDLARWKATHARPVVNDCCRWSEAFESIARTNARAFFTIYFVWPRVLLRAMTGA